RHKLLPDMAPPEAAVEEIFSKDPTVMGYAARLNQLEAKVEAIRQASRPETFAKASAAEQKQIETIRQELDKYKQENRPKIVQKLRETNERNYQAYLAALEQRIKILKEFETELNDEVKRLGEKTRTMSGQVMDLEEFKSDILLTEDMTKKAMAEV